MTKSSVPPDAGQPPRAAQPSPPVRADTGPEWPRRVVRAALGAAALLVIPVTVGGIVALATGIEGNPDNVLIGAALLLAFWTALTLLNLWLGRDAEPEDT